MGRGLTLPFYFGEVCGGLRNIGLARVPKVPIRPMPNENRTACITVWMAGRGLRSGRGGKCMIWRFGPGAGDGRAAAGGGAWRVGGGFSRRKRFLRDDKTPPHRPEPFWLPPSGSLTVPRARSRIPHRLARFFAARRAQVWASHRHQHRLWDYLRARQVAHDRSTPGYHNICPLTARWR